MKETRKLNEDDIYKDAPGLDPELEWAEEDHWIKKLIINGKIKKRGGYALPFLTRFFFVKFNK